MQQKSNTVAHDEDHSDAAAVDPTILQEKTPCSKGKLKDPINVGSQSCKTQPSSNSFSVLNDVTEELDKENVLPKRVRKPTSKVADNLNVGIEGLSKGIENKPPKKKGDVTFLECEGIKQFSKAISVENLSEKVQRGYCLPIGNSCEEGKPRKNSEIYLT